MKPDLLPCPFCGGEAESRLYDAQHFVQCIQCFNSTAADHDLEESAVSAWNARAKSAHAEVDAELVELIGECRGIVAREVERWNRVAAFLLEDGKVESSLLARIDAKLAEVKCV